MYLRRQHTREFYGLGGVLRCDTKSKIHQRKIPMELDFIKSKSFALRDPVKRIKIQDTDW